MTRTDTAHQHWTERWSTDAGRADWLTPEPWVAAAAETRFAKGDRTVLDLGAGVGRHALMLAATGWTTSALDAAPDGVKVLEDTARAEGLEIAAKVGLMTELPFPDQAFDMVVSINVIYHGDREIITTALAEIARVLKPGGWFVATLLSKRNRNVGQGREISPGTWVNDADPTSDKIHPHFYCNARETVDLLKDFELIKLEDFEDPAKPGSWHWSLIAERL